MIVSFDLFTPSVGAPPAEFIRFDLSPRWPDVIHRKATPVDVAKYAEVYEKFKAAEPAQLPVEVAPAIATEPAPEATPAASTETTPVKKSFFAKLTKGK